MSCGAFDKCNTSCTVDTKDTCDHGVGTLDNVVGYTCADPKAVPTLDQYSQETAGQLVDPINALVAGCGGFMPMFDFTCNSRFTQELNRYMFPGVDESVLGSNDKTAQFDYYRNFTSTSQAFSYASAFTAAENVHIEEIVCPIDGEKKCFYALLWKEKKNDDGKLRLVADAATGDVDVTLDYVSGLAEGGYLTIIPCSEDECAIHPFTSEIDAVDLETGVVTLCDPLPRDVFAVQASEDGCATCETCAYYTMPNVDCGDKLPEVGMLGGQEEVVKKAYFKNYGAIIPFNKKELHQCIQCAGDFGGDEYGYATGNATLARKLGDFRKVFDQTLLHDYFYAPGPGFSKKNCAPTTGPGIITSILADDAAGCCSSHNLCGKKPVEKALAMLDIFDSIECCDMGDRNPDVRMIVNQKFLTNWKKMTKEWNRLLSVPTCCEAQDGMKDFNRLVSVRSYLQDRPFTPEFSDYLSKMYPNVSIALFVPQGWSIMRTFDTSIDQGLNVVNGTNVNFMSIKELDKDDNDCFNCERAIKITGSYLIANVGECTGKRQMIVGL